METNLSIPEGIGICEYLIHEIPGITIRGRKNSTNVLFRGHVFWGKCVNGMPDRHKYAICNHEKIFTKHL